MPLPYLRLGIVSMFFLSHNDGLRATVTGEEHSKAMSHHPSGRAKAPHHEGGALIRFEPAPRVAPGDGVVRARLGQ